MYKFVLLSILCAGCAFAQTESAPGKAVTIQLKDPGELAPTNLFYVRTGFVGSTPPVAGAPYSAQSTTQRVQVLSDGNRIEQTTSGNVARDGQGRVRNEAMVAGITLPTGDTPHLITMNDPVAGYNYTLDSDHKIAFKMPVPKNAPLGPKDAPLEIGAGNMAGKQVQIGITAGPAGNVITKLGDPSDANVTKTDLGKQTMEGVLVQGTRVTRTIPAGSIGNEQLIVITSETWYAPDLKVLVMSKSVDPRIGETTYRLTNIQRSEPSPALFEIPADYTIKEGPGNAIFSEKLPAPKQ
jgi:hypothetical protein